MNDKGLIIAGLAVFVAVAMFPVWYTLGLAEDASPPVLELPEDGSQCIEKTQWMIENHMKLLRQWRNAVVREGQKTYISEDFGDSHEMSLTKTCLKCHSDRETFCNRCHNYADVSPGCWNCHLDPKGM